MRLFEFLAFLPVFGAFVLGATVASEGTQTASTAPAPVVQSGSLYPFIAVALLFAFVASALFFMAREMRREEREKRNQENSG